MLTRENCKTVLDLKEGNSTEYSLWNFVCGGVQFFDSFISYYNYFLDCYVTNFSWKTWKHDQTQLGLCVFYQTTVASCFVLTYILLTRADPLHLIIKNIKKASTHSRNYLLSQRTPHTETNILPIITSFSDMVKQLTAIIHRNWHTVANDTTLSTIWPSKLLSAYTKSNSIHNHLVYSANIRLLTARLLEPLATRTHIHQYGHTHI